MSFILDALRKSDAERQRGVAPGLADVRYAAGRRRRNVWVPLLALVLTANIGFMAWLWYDGGNQPAAEAPVESATPPAAPAAGPVAAPEVRALARETASAEPVAPPAVESDLPDRPFAAQAPQVPAAEAQVPAVAPQAEQLPAKPSRIVADPALPTLDQLLGAGTLDLPPLNLDLLVYNESPSVRFVVINGRKYREGAQLTEGPALESITPEGVILGSRGQRFILNRK